MYVIIQSIIAMSLFFPGICYLTRSLLAEIRDNQKATLSIHREKNDLHVCVRQPASRVLDVLPIFRLVMN